MKHVSAAGCTVWINTCKYSILYFFHKIWCQKQQLCCLLSVGFFLHYRTFWGKKIMKGGKISPRNHFHCWAIQDSGSNLHRPRLFLIAQSFSRHNKPPVVWESDFPSTRRWRQHFKAFLWGSKCRWVGSVRGQAWHKWAPRSVVAGIADAGCTLVATIGNYAAALDRQLCSIQSAAMQHLTEGLVPLLLAVSSHAASHGQTLHFVVALTNLGGARLCYP